MSSFESSRVEPSQVERLMLTSAQLAALNWSWVVRQLFFYAASMQAAVDMFLEYIGIDGGVDQQNAIIQSIKERLDENASGILFYLDLSSPTKIGLLVVIKLWNIVAFTAAGGICYFTNYFELNLNKIIKYF